MPRKKKPLQVVEEQEAKDAIVVVPSGAKLFEEPPEVPVARPNDGVPALDGDLTSEQKTEFVRLLTDYMPVEARARQLVKLAQFTDTKRAPVALRAIQEINAITGITKEVKDDDSAMFVMPEGVKIAVQVNEAKK